MSLGWKVDGSGFSPCTWTGWGGLQGLLWGTGDSKAWALVSTWGGGHSVGCSHDTEGNWRAAICGGLGQAGRQLSMGLSSNLEKCAALQLMGLAWLPAFVGILAEEWEVQRGEQVLSSSVCILWLCRFFHWEYSSEVSLVTEPKWIKEVLDSQPQKKHYYVLLSIIISSLWYPPRTFPHWPLPVPGHITPWVNPFHLPDQPLALPCPPLSRSCKPLPRSHPSDNISPSCVNCPPLHQSVGCC